MRIVGAEGGTGDSVLEDCPMARDGSAHNVSAYSRSVRECMKRMRIRDHPRRVRRIGLGGIPIQSLNMSLAFDPPEYKLLDQR